MRALEIVTCEILTFWTAATVKSHRKDRVGNGGRLRANNGAEGGTRTPTGVTPPPPQDGVSTSSTTSARMYDGNGTPDLSTEIWPWVVGHFARDPYKELVRILFAEPALRCFTLFSMTDEGLSHSSLFLIALNRPAPLSIVDAARLSFRLFRE